MQYEPPREQWPPLQRCEQHWSFIVHSLPAVLHDPLSGVHVAPPHLPPQQLAPPAASAPQLLPSEMHCAAAQNPFAPQVSEQQSVGAVHGVPSTRHLPTTEVHVLVLGSQTPEQHVAPPAPARISAASSPPHAARNDRNPAARNLLTVMSDGLRPALRTTVLGCRS